MMALNNLLIITATFLSSVVIVTCGTTVMEVGTGLRTSHAKIAALVDTNALGQAAYAYISACISVGGSIIIAPFFVSAYMGIFGLLFGTPCLVYIIVFGGRMLHFTMCECHAEATKLVKRRREALAGCSTSEVCIQVHHASVAADDMPSNVPELELGIDGGVSLDL